MSYLEDEEEELYNVRMKEYEVPWWVRMVASLPRIDLAFDSIKTSFNFNDPKYKESILFWVAVPVLWLLFTLFLFLIYFCYRCCQRDDSDKRGKVACLKWTLSIITILACGVVGVGICGNEDSNKGVTHVISSFSDILATTNSIKANVGQLIRTVNNTVLKDVTHLKQLFPHHASGQLDNDQLMAYATQLLDQFRIQLHEEVAAKMVGLNYQPQVNFIKNCEFYRRLGSVGLFGWFILLLLILLAGIGNNSKCILLLFCAFGIFSLVLTGLFSGIHLGVSIALGDFCSDPDTIVSNYVNEYVDPSITDYYIRCDLNMEANPFSVTMKRTTENLINANHTIMQLVFKTNEYVGDSQRTQMFELQTRIQKSFSTIRTTFYNLVSLVECTNVHKDYLDILDGVCYQTMPGVLLMLGSSLATGILFSLLIIISSKVWKLFGNYKSYTEGDEDEGGPFIAHQQNPSPSYYGYPKLRPQSSHIAPYNRRTTPPPAYNSNEFYRQYNDLTNESIRNDYSLRESNA